MIEVSPDKCDRGQRIKRVRRFQIYLDGTPYALHIPKSATLLGIQHEDSMPYAYALCSDVEMDGDHTWFYVYATDAVLPDDPGKYVGTFQSRMTDGRLDVILSWHLFDGSDTALNQDKITRAMEDAGLTEYIEWMHEYYPSSDIDLNYGEGLVRRIVRASMKACP